MLPDQIREVRSEPVIRLIQVTAVTGERQIAPEHKQQALDTPRLPRILACGACRELHSAQQRTRNGEQSQDDFQLRPEGIQPFESEVLVQLRNWIAGVGIRHNKSSMG